MSLPNYNVMSHPQLGQNWLYAYCVLDKHAVRIHDVVGAFSAFLSELILIEHNGSVSYENYDTTSVFRPCTHVGPLLQVVLYL